MKLYMTRKGASEQLISLNVEVGVNNAIIAISPESYKHLKKYCNYKKEVLLTRSEYAMMTITATVELQDGVVADNFEEKYSAATVAVGRTYNPKRLVKVNDYKIQMDNGDVFPPPILMFQDGQLIQIDGARRIMARALTQADTLEIIVIIRRRDIVSLLEPEFIQKIKMLHKTKKWFNDYQEIVELGLSGKRSYNGRFPNVLDFSLFEGKTIVEFACSNGMALFEAYYCGATRVIGFEFVQQNVDIINLMAARLGIPVEAHRVDFNDPDWLDQVHRVIAKWDYSVFLSTYRTLELKDRDGLVRGIWEGSKEGMIFEGHQQAIDTDQFYRNVFSTQAALTDYEVKQLPRGIIETPYDADYRPKYLLTRVAR